MKVLIPGGTGLIGRAVGEALRARGDEVIVLTRQASRRPDHVRWDPSRGVPVRALEGVDAVFHLVGAPLATRPWTQARREVLRASRIDATRALAASLERLDAPPRHWIGVSTIGRFGDCGDRWVTPDTPRGTGFLAQLAEDWEQAQQAAAARLDARIAWVRLGTVLTARGGVLPLLLPPFRHGFGGWIGDGSQYTPWIGMDDAVGALLHLLDDPAARGAFHGVSPEPILHRAWCEAIGEAVGRPVRGPVQGWAVRGALGELADALLLASVRTRPARLVDRGYRFREPDLGGLLERVVWEVSRQA